MRKLAAAFLAILMLSAFAVPASAWKGSKKPKPYEETGHVLLPGAPVTWYEFVLGTCPGMPTTQGVTGYVFKLPREMLNRRDLVLEVTTTSLNPVSGLGLAYYDLTCGSLGTEVPAGPVALPPGTAFIQASDFFSANFDVTIRVMASGRDVPTEAVTPPAEPGKPGASRVKPYKTTGHVLAPGPFSITYAEFALSSCPSMPSTQGVTSYVIEIPNYLRGLSDLAVTAIGGGELPQVTDALRFTFFSSTCELIESGQAPAAMPPNAAFVDVHGYFRANFDFKLTIQQLRSQ